MPDTVTLFFARPPGFAHLSPAEFKDLVTARVRQFEEIAAAERRRTGAAVLGRRAVLDQRWSDQPGSCEPRRQLNRIASPHPVPAGLRFVLLAAAQTAACC